MTTPIVTSPVVTMNENEEPVLQDPIGPIVAHEEEQQQPQVEEVAIVEALEGLKELENQLSLKTMKSMLVKKFKWSVIPPHLKKP
jgi:hypothetical protein